MLNITVDINGVIVERLKVKRLYPLRRLSNTIKEDLKVPCTYMVRNHYDLVVGKIHRHRYGDGAARLAAKVLKKFGRKSQQ